MGCKLSRFLQAWKIAVNVQKMHEQLSKRISKSPGLPSSRPTASYWVDPLSPISDYRSAEYVPEYADIVIIGSGLTGTSIARTVLDESSKPVSVVMLDARSACYGATARNGGHITPVLYLDYPQLKEELGQELATKIMRFRLHHLETFLEVAEEEGLLEQSQCRRVDTLDVYFDSSFFNSAKKCLAVYSADLPVESRTFRVVETKEELQALQLSPRAVGCIVTKAGALHPYRLITGILSRLLCDFKDQFQLFTHTPCTAIETAGSSYVVHTPRGVIRASHVVHATNAWSSHLIPGFRRKIVPTQIHMTAQRPGQGLSTDWTGKRSFVFYPGRNKEQFDYLTQQPLIANSDTPHTNSATPAGEFMFGGGVFQDGIPEITFLDAFGNADDSSWNFQVVSNLSGTLGLYFDKHWGKETSDDTNANPNWDEGRVMGKWTGIIGVSADLMPWVGQLPDAVTQRGIKPASDRHSSGEWICAGYSGEGMPQAWMSGIALAQMLVESLANKAGQSSDEKSAQPDHWTKWLPEVYLVTEERWRKANIDWVFGV